MLKPLRGMFLGMLLASFSLTSSYGTTDVISNTRTSYNDTHFYFTYTISLTQEFHRIYIDNTRDPTKGFPVAGIGAKYLIENSLLYQYVGPGWNWKLIKNIPYAITWHKLEWTFGRNDVGNNSCAGALDYVFQVQVGSTISTTNKNTFNFTDSTSCQYPTPIPSTTQKIAVPSYFWPNCANNPECDWNRLNNAVPKVGLTVINPNNGSGSYVDPAFSSAVQKHKAAGGTVLGYVDTAYGTRNMSIVQNDITNYYLWYGVDGIFFDQGYGSDCNKLTYYQVLNQFVKSKGGKAITVINYGANPAECYINASDILLTFEGTYSYYLTWKPATWQTKYEPKHFYHLIYATPQDKIYDAISRSKTNRAGWIYTTPLNLPNPWVAIPTPDYWSIELNAVN